MSKSVTENLTSLKPFLVSGYQKKIAQEVEGVALWQVKRAFSGRSINSEILFKIYTKAAEMASENLKMKQEVKRKTDEVIELASKLD